MARDEKERLRRNSESLAHAEHHAQGWLLHEVEILMEWDGTEEELADLAELLGRTIEACRQRYYETRAGRVAIPVEQDEASRTIKEAGGSRRTSLDLGARSQRETWPEEDREQYGSWYV